MASVNDDYEEDWEPAEPSVSKKSLVSATGGQVYPAESDEYDLTRDVEPTRQEDPVTISVEVPERKVKALDEGFKFVDLKTKVDETTAAGICVLSEEVPTSEGTLSSDGEKVTALPAGGPSPGISDVFTAHHLLDLVRIHGHHYGRQTPPPIPVEISVASKGALRSKVPPKPDIGALQARVAAKRIAEFRGRHEVKAEAERALESAWTQKRREIRRSNDVMHKALGVAGLSAQDHLRIAQRRRKQETREKEIVASLERQNRWYNSIPKRPLRSPHHARELQLQLVREKREWEHRLQLKQKSIRANQLELRQKAQSIIAKSSGAYVRGSYLLQVTHHTIKTHNQPPPNDQKDIAADQKDIAAE
ncbi:hypothetical protein PHYPSEUDO_015052 [Phytophthora pseudosyringae]|uniref:Uncharacterized protein n=1 Tax=Phytophthora pseudosyringae TaxID=221518 RepID=A0A8T1WJU0_9STRA|nr:hypothetical protein PHYPSEUDO_015052 [Phytophthora pseudosyringae]